MTDNEVGWLALLVFVIGCLLIVWIYSHGGGRGNNERADYNEPSYGQPGFERNDRRYTPQPTLSIVRIDEYFMIPLANFNLKDGVVTDGEVSFQSSSGNVHTLDIMNQTCSCPFFQNNYLAQYPKGSFPRLCNHLFTALFERDAIDEYDHAWDAIRGRPHKPMLLLKCQHPAEGFLIGIGYQNNEWADVYWVGGKKPGRSPDPNRTFGWSMRQKRWSYGSAPVGAGGFRRCFEFVDGVKFRYEWGEPKVLIEISDKNQRRLARGIR